MLRKRETSHKAHMLRDLLHLRETSRMSRSPDTDRRPVVIRGWGRGEWGVTPNMYEILWGGMKGFKINCDGYTTL